MTADHIIFPQTVSELRANIMGIDAEAPVLDGTTLPYVFLDNGASTPAFRQVFQVLERFMQYYSAVHRGTGFKAILATEAFDEAHAVAGRFVHADLERNTVIFLKNTTEAVNKLANRTRWRDGDVVITTLMEHHSNDLPWRKYARVVHVGVNDFGYLDMRSLRDAFEQYKNNVRILCVTGASNITGIVNPVHELAELAHRYGAMIFVDAAQLVPHRSIDVLPNHDPGHIDFLAYSAHKMYAPFGTGVLIGPTDWFMEGDPDMVGGGVVEIVEEDFVAWSPPPAREEAGSTNVPGGIALAAAIRVLEGVGLDAIAEHERALIAYAVEKLREVPGLTIYGPGKDSLEDKVGVLTFNIQDVPHSLVASILSCEGAVGVRNGCFCAHPYVKRLLKFNEDNAKAVTAEILGGNRTNLPGMVRASFGCYNNRDDIDRLAEMLCVVARKQYKGTYRLDRASGSYWPEGFRYPLHDYFPYLSFTEAAVADTYAGKT